MPHDDQMHVRAAERSLSIAEQDRDALLEGAFYFGALCCLASIAALLLAALALVGSCR